MSDRRLRAILLPLLILCAAPRPAPAEDAPPPAIDWRKLDDANLADWTADSYAWVDLDLAELVAIGERLADPAAGKDKTPSTVRNQARRGRRTIAHFIGTRYLLKPELVRRTSPKEWRRIHRVFESDIERGGWDKHLRAAWTRDPSVAAAMTVEQIRELIGVLQDLGGKLPASPNQAAAEWLLAQKDWSNLSPADFAAFARLAMRVRLAPDGRERILAELADRWALPGVSDAFTLDALRAVVDSYPRDGATDKKKRWALRAYHDVLARNVERIDVATLSKLVALLGRAERLDRGWENQDFMEYARALIALARAGRLNYEPPVRSGARRAGSRGPVNYTLRPLAGPVRTEKARELLRDNLAGDDGIPDRRLCEILDESYRRKGKQAHARWLTWLTERSGRGPLPVRAPWILARCRALGVPSSQIDYAPVCKIMAAADVPLPLRLQAAELLRDAAGGAAHLADVPMNLAGYARQVRAWAPQAEGADRVQIDVLADWARRLRERHIAVIERHAHFYGEQAKKLADAGKPNPDMQRLAERRRLELIVATGEDADAVGQAIAKLADDDRARRRTDANPPKERAPYTLPALWALTRPESAPIIKAAIPPGDSTTPASR